MDGDTANTPFEQIVELLNAHGVEFVIIGGQAETLHGSPRVTFDTDLCYGRSAGNFDRLADALARINPSLRGAPPDLPFRLDAESLRSGINFTLRTDAGDLDLIGHVEPIGGYEEVLQCAETIRLDASEIKILSLDALIRIKEHIQRPKDHESLMHLQAIRRMRDKLR